MRGNFPDSMNKLIDDANKNNVAVMVFDHDNRDLLFKNKLTEVIYSFLTLNQGTTYDDFVVNCLESKLVDDPTAYSDHVKWLMQAHKFKKETSFAQYIIRHNTGKVYLARHQNFVGAGIFCGRLDITESFSAGTDNFFSGISGKDPVTGNSLTFTHVGKSDIAIAIVSPSGVVMDANLPFLELSQRKDGIMIVEGRLSAFHKDDSVFLENIILKISSSKVPQESKMRKIKREAPSSFYIANVSMLCNNSHDLGTKIYGACAVTIIDPMSDITVPSSVLQKTFGLTPAEARVSAAIASGYSLSEISEKYIVSIGTLRNQLKSIFTKIGVNRQSELVRIIVNVSKITAYSS